MINVKTAFFLALCGLPLGAAQIFNVSVQTSTLASGTSVLDFQFLDGGGTGTEPNNTATISQFNFGSGVQNIAPITLQDSFPSDQQLPVTLGSVLSFQVSITNNADVGGAPDALSFGILSNGTPITTTDPSGALIFFTEPASGNGPVSVQTFDAPGATPVFAPSVNPAAAIPEPSELVVVAMALGLIGFGRRGLRTKAQNS